MKLRFFLVTLLFVAGLTLGCSLFVPGGTTGENSGMAGDAPESRPTVVMGMGNVAGSVWWNSRAAANIHVELCERYSFFSGCSGNTFSTISNEDGTYFFTEIPPGTYYIAMRVFNTDDWLYLTEGFISAKPFTVTAGKTTQVESYNLYKLDIKPTHPITNIVSPGDITLSWRSYESASYYEITLYPAQGESILSGQRVESNEITATIPAQNCEYSWQIEAFNQDAIKIAETDGFLVFEVTGQTASCILDIISPADNTTMASGNSIVLAWAEHPAAAYYDVLMWNDSLPERPHVLDFIGTTVPTLHIGQALEPGRYVWSIRAFDETGKQIAGSGTADFTVE